MLELHSSEGSAGDDDDRLAAHNPGMRIQITSKVKMSRRLSAVCSLLLTLALLVLAPMAACEEAVSWRFDTEDSQIRFELAALGVVPIRGTFDRFTGEIWHEAGEDSLRVVVRIDATSLSMPSGRYRDWARSPEFFHVDRYPEISFTSDPIGWGLLAEGGVLHGRLTVRGEVRDVEFEIAPGGCRKSARTCELHVSGEINRTRFGMRSRRLALSSRVHLDMSFKAIAEPVQRVRADEGDQSATRR